MYCISTAMVQESFRHPDHESITAVARSAVSKPSSVVRRKFAKPPVKVACLAWSAPYAFYGPGVGALFQCLLY